MVACKYFVSISINKKLYFFLNIIMKKIKQIFSKTGILYFLPHCPIFSLISFLSIPEKKFSWPSQRFNYIYIFEPETTFKDECWKAFTTSGRHDDQAKKHKSFKNR